METAPPTTAGLSRGWCGLHSASPGANYLPSRTPTAPYVTRMPKRSSIKDNNHPSHCLFTPLPSRRRGQYMCIKAWTERLKNCFYLSSSDCKMAITSTERLLPTYTDLKSLATLIINGKIVTLIMFTYLASLISYVYTVFYTIYCILVYAALTLLIHIFIYS
jgi:hypothetical protein